MPRQRHNVSRQRSRGSTITINGLLTWRARSLRDLRISRGDPEIAANIAAIDRVLVNVIGFTGDIEALTRDFTRDTLFGRGELQRMVATVLREANRPLTAREITTIVIRRKGMEMAPGARSKQWITRARKVCQRLPAEVSWAEDGAMAWGRR